MFYLNDAALSIISGSNNYPSFFHGLEMRHFLMGFPHPLAGCTCLVNLVERLVFVSALQRSTQRRNDLACCVARSMWPPYKYTSIVLSRTTKSCKEVHYIT